MKICILLCVTVLYICSFDLFAISMVVVVITGFVQISIIEKNACVCGDFVEFLHIQPCYMLQCTKYLLRKYGVQIKMPSMPTMPSICPVDIFIPRSLGIFILNTRHFYTYKYDQYYEQ